MLVVAGIPLAAAGAICSLCIESTASRRSRRAGATSVLIAFGVCALVNAVRARVVARTRCASGAAVPPDAQQEAERWEAFRRYLTDFPRLDIAPPASLELWERLLVYGIAFGIAERVLQGAQLHMPEELHDASSIYWISPTSDLGSGPSALGISDLSAASARALAPPSSGSGGDRRRLLRRRRGRRRRRWRRGAGSYGDGRRS